jgi:pyruvate dehydrogenase E1 component
MESLFRAVGIYSSIGQLYEPVDMDTLLYYKEAKDGQILEEGITEAGSISSWIAAGTAYSTYGVNTIPFFIFYSMFGFQRVGDFIWAAADSRCRGFLLGGTSGRTTLAGEGLQHQDGNSHTLALPVPTCRAYDPAYAYELAVIIRDGIKRMYGDGEEAFYYITVMNEQYAMPAMPEGAEEGIIKGLYKFSTAPVEGDSPASPKAKANPSTSVRARAQLIGSGAILNEVVKAQEILAKYGVAADVWSATSYNELYRDAHRTERWNLWHPTEPAKKPWVAQCLAETPGIVVAVSDYLKSQPDMISRWIGRPVVTLGTDGFGRSEDRASLRDFFEVDARHIAAATLSAMHREGDIDAKTVREAFKALQINPDKADPAVS